MAFGDFTVVRSTVKRVLNSSGVLASVAVNTPAFEFNADGTYKGLLVEPAGTNLALQSQDFTTSWNPARSSVSANAIVAPDGTTTADKLVEDTTAANNHNIQQSTASVPAGNYTVSVFAKAGERTQIGINTTGVAPAIFDLSLGTIISAGGVTGSKIEDYGDGWYRCSVYGTANGTTDFSTFFIVVAGATNYNGDGTSGIYIWGAQLETGSVATSYIPTVASTATRGADVISLASASSLIGQTGGWIYAEANLTSNGSASASSIVALSDVIGEDDVNRILIGKGVNNKKPLFQIRQGNALLFNIVGADDYPNGTNKILARYGNGTSALFLNGVKIGDDVGVPAFTVPLAVVKAGYYFDGIGQVNDHLRAFALGTTTLSDAQAIALTTL